MESEDELDKLRQRLKQVEQERDELKSRVAALESQLRILGVEPPTGSTIH